MFSQPYIRLHKANFAILLFLILFGIFHFVKPAFAYGREGEFRQFGVGYQNKTVVPVWIVAIALAILCYVAVGSYSMMA
jgi:quinol-cytochrome oxidoreductase complex cytochrome b subunit